MGMLTNNRASNTSVVNMTPMETKFKEQLLLLANHGIMSPQDAVTFLLDVIQTDKQTISAEFQSLREDSIDEQISAIETAADMYRWESENPQERKANLKDAIKMMAPSIRTLLKRMQRYVDNVIQIDNMPKAKRILSPFHQLGAKVDNFSFCARICFEGAVVGMTYARAMDVELGGTYAKALVEEFNQCVNWLTDGNRRCFIMSEYAADENLEAFWLEIPQASTRMINSGDWDAFTQIAEKSSHTKIAPAPAPAQIAAKKPKPGLFFRLKRWISGFFRRLVFLFTGKPFEEETPHPSANAGQGKLPDSRNANSDAEDSDYEHIVF